VRGSLLLPGLMVGALVLGMAAQAKAQPSYFYNVLEVPGSFGTRARGINDLSQIVGDYLDAYTLLDPPGSIRSEAFGINNSGQIVGSYAGHFLAPGFLATRRHHHGPGH
jgi:hypothetical protein